MKIKGKGNERLLLVILKKEEEGEAYEEEQCLPLKMKWEVTSASDTIFDSVNNDISEILSSSTIASKIVVTQTLPYVDNNLKVNLNNKNLNRMKSLLLNHLQILILHHLNIYLNLCRTNHLHPLN